MRKQRARVNRAGGFTLIELLIVVAIISIIAAIAIPSMQNSMEKARQRGTMGDMHGIGTGVSMYEIDHSHYPATATPPSDLVVMIYPFIQTHFPSRDKWYHDYAYTTDGFNWYSLESFGKDGVDGVDITHATRFQFNLDLVLATGQFTASPEK